jgi:hypothetical protein
MGFRTPKIDSIANEFTELRRSRTVGRRSNLGEPIQIQA